MDDDARPDPGGRGSGLKNCINIEEIKQNFDYLFDYFFDYFLLKKVL